jgi:pyruvyltransferase
MVRSARQRMTTTIESDPYSRVKLIYWTPGDGSINFGDLLSKVIVSQILAGSGRSLDDEVQTATRLLAVGSILHFAKTNDVIWGSGVNIPSDFHNFSDLDVRSVRGPLTAEFLYRKGIKVSEIYGDPALLLPLLFPNRFLVKPCRPYVVVPNLFDLEAVKNWPNVVSPLAGWNRCITQILEAELVIASSLHGIIIAEAYGIPARQLRISKTAPLFRYQDYYEGTGRHLAFARSVPEAVELGGMQPVTIDHRKLLNAFPWDLWD